MNCKHYPYHSIDIKVNIDMWHIFGKCVYCNKYIEAIYTGENMNGGIRTYEM